MARLHLVEFVYSLRQVEHTLLAVSLDALTADAKLVEQRLNENAQPTSARRRVHPKQLERHHQMHLWQFIKALGPCDNGRRGMHAGWTKRVIPKLLKATVRPLVDSRVAHIVTCDRNNFSAEPVVAGQQGDESTFGFLALHIMVAKIIRNVLWLTLVFVFGCEVAFMASPAHELGKVRGMAGSWRCNHR